MTDELNILREIGNIAAGHGGIALSGILGKKLNLAVPSCRAVYSCEDLKEINLDKMGIVVFSRLLVGLEGEVVFILDEKNGYKIIELYYDMGNKPKDGLSTEMGISLIKEVGSIVIGAYLNALSLLLKRIIVPPLPTLVSGSIRDILEFILSPYAEDECSYLVETIFEEPKEDIRGSFYLILTPKAAKEIHKVCLDSLRELE